MIIRSLVDYYEQLCKSKADEVPSYGWLSQPIHYYLMLSPDGRLRSIVPCGNEKHGLLAVVPQKLRGTSDGRANFLWDNSLYLLGVNGDGQLEDGLKSFNKSRFCMMKCWRIAKDQYRKPLKASMHIGTPSKGGLTRFPGLAMTCAAKESSLPFA